MLISSTTPMVLVWAEVTRLSRPVSPRLVGLPFSLPSLEVRPRLTLLTGRGNY